MKLLSLSIEGYKNLKDETKASFDFANCTNYVALIGLNGSGKSNVLEVISLIFASYYHGLRLSFNYEIKYILERDIIVIKNRVMTVEGKGRIKRDEQLNYLPENVIASYSGEELRMWEQIYEESYANFFQDIRSQSSFVPKLLYINKYCWDFALIVLLCSENHLIQKFIRDVLKIGEDVEIRFTIEKGNYGLYENNEALSLIKRIVDLQNKSTTTSVHINELRTLDIGQRDNKDFIKRLFYYLFITGMPARSDRVNVDKIIKKTELKFNDINLKSFSEGEKKLILIHTITHLLADNRTLVLLDEPDAHIHIDRKKEIIDIIDQENHFTVFTTHSPKILHCINDDNVRLINNDLENGVEVLQINKANALAKITNGEFTLADASIAINTSKDILLVEGKYDHKYITKALDVLNRQIDFEIFPCGGDANVASVLEILLPRLKPMQLCIALFDNDSGGDNGSKKVKELFEDETIPNNIKILKTPKWEGWEEPFFIIEDYFPVGFYLQKIKDEFNNAATHHDINKIKKSPKEWIQDYFDTIQHHSPDDFQHFNVLFDKLDNEQSQFHSLPL